MKQIDLSKMSEDFRSDIVKAITILQDLGCTEIFLFGSLVHNKSNEYSDIDIAVKGLPSELFFRAMGLLMMKLEHPIDLIDLDDQSKFSQFLQEEKVLVRVA